MACRRSQVRSLSGPKFKSSAKAGLFNLELQALVNAKWPGSPLSTKPKGLCSKPLTLRRYQKGRHADENQHLPRTPLLLVVTNKASSSHLQGSAISLPHLLLLKKHVTTAS